MTAREAELRLVERLVEAIARNAKTELPEMEDVSLDKTRYVVTFTLAGVEIEMPALEFLAIYATEPLEPKGGA